MANKIPLAVADFQTQISTALPVGGTSFTLTSATDDDGNALPAGQYCFTVDNGKSVKEYLLGQLNGRNVTGVVRVSRQGVETSGAQYRHRIGAPVIVTDFATIQRVADVLRGKVTLDGDNPLYYDGEPTLADRKELATVGYVLDNVTGGTVAFDAQTITGTAGEDVVAGNLVYFKTSDQEWYKTDATDADTVEGVQLGIAQGAGSDGVAISGGIQISGTYTTTGLTAGSRYYASDTAGAIATTAGTVPVVVGVALSTTRLMFIPQNNPSNTFVSTSSGASDAGKVVKLNASGQMPHEFLSVKPLDIQEFTTSGTWTKPVEGNYAVVEIWGAGGSGRSGFSSTSTSAYSGGGGGGECTRKMILLTSLGSTESVTIGTGGTSVTGQTNGNAGGGSSFGSHITVGGGGGGTATTTGGIGGGYGENVESGGNGGYSASGVATHGGHSLYGGGGGGGMSGQGVGASPGTSKYGGSGGNGAGGNPAVASPGNVPGGGGGGAYAVGASASATSGAGGNGFCRVTVF